MTPINYRWEIIIKDEQGGGGGVVGESGEGVGSLIGEVCMQKNVGEE